MKNKKELWILGSLLLIIFIELTIGFVLNTLNLLKNDNNKEPQSMGDEVTCVWEAGNVTYQKDLPTGCAASLSQAGNISEGAKVCTYNRISGSSCPSVCDKKCNQETLGSSSYADPDDNNIVNYCYRKTNFEASCSKTCDPGKYLDEGECKPCTITINNVSGFKHMSVGETETVSFSISGGSACGNKVTVSTSYFNGPSEVDADTDDNYNPARSCVTGTIKGCIKGTDICSSSISIELLPAWARKIVHNISESIYNNAPKSASDANIHSKDYYYESGKCTGLRNGVYEECIFHNRGCGDAPQPPSERLCYVNRTGDENIYQEATSSPGTGWEVYSGTCSETAACYKKSDGTYVTGKYAERSGYTYVGATCPTEKCYIKRASGGNEYKLATTSPGTGWEEYSGTCSEAAACYKKSDGTYVTGKYAERSGYTYVGATCPTEKCYIKRASGGNEYKLATTSPGTGWEEYSGTCSETAACYKKSDGTYVIGKYAGRSEYTHVGATCPTETKCYIKKSSSGNEYKLATTSPGTGWEEYSGTCNEEEACYKKSDGTYIIGKYAGRSEYTHVGATCPAETKCYIKKSSSGNEYKLATTSPGTGWEEYSGTCSEEAACYLHDEKVVWGQYKGVAGYDLINNVSSVDECKLPEPEIVDAPPTGVNIELIALISSIVLIGIGIGFLHYGRLGTKK